MTTFPVLQTFEKDQTKINFTINQLARGMTSFSSILLNVLDFGADPTGTTSSSDAIASAIAQASSVGGDVIFPPGTYLLTQTIAIGDGTSANEATTKSIRLRGLGLPADILGLGFSHNTSSVKFLWGGAGGSNMLQVNGPLQGWGIENIEFDAASTAASCLRLNSASFGDCANLVFSRAATIAVFSTAYNTFAAIGKANSMHNLFRNTVVNLTAATSAGILLTGVIGGAASANTCYNCFINTTINFSGAATTTGAGIIAQACDSNVFINLHFYSGAAGSANVIFDYTVTPQWPSNIHFYSVDPSGGGTGFVNNGTPSGSFANRVFGLVDGNGGVVPRALANLVNEDKIHSVNISVAAAGATQATATILPADWNVVSPVAAATGVLLNTAPGTDQIVYNAGGNNLNVYPPVGAQIDGLAINAAYVLVPGKKQIFLCLVPTIFQSETAAVMG